jgi:hypothetical protein
MIRAKSHGPIETHIPVGVRGASANSTLAEAPHPDLLPRRSGLPDLRIIDTEVGQARLR